MLKTITKAAVLAVVAGGLSLTAAVPASAQTDPVARGLLCGFGSVTDPTIENGEVQTGEMDGGPIVATAAGATISIKCTIQVGAANATHAGADSASAASAASLQTATLPPTLVSYLSPEGQPVYMCTEITVNGEVYYYDSNPPGTGAWVQSSAAFCSEAISQEIFPGPLGPILDMIDPLLDQVFGIVDPLVCPVIGLLDPVDVPGVVEIDSDGDINLLGGPFWLCPPYET